MVLVIGRRRGGVMQHRGLRRTLLVSLAGNSNFKLKHLSRVGAVGRGVMLLLVVVVRRRLGCRRRVEGHMHRLGVQGFDVVGNALRKNVQDGFRIW